MEEASRKLGFCIQLVYSEGCEQGMMCDLLELSEYTVSLEPEMKS